MLCMEGIKTHFNLLLVVLFLRKHRQFLQAEIIESHGLYISGKCSRSHITQQKDLTHLIRAASGGQLPHEQ